MSTKDSGNWASLKGKECLQTLMALPMPVNGLIITNMALEFKNCLMALLIRGIIGKVLNKAKVYSPGLIIPIMKENSIKIICLVRENL